MAVAALSIAHRESREMLEPLQHYHQATSALQDNLRGPDDIYKDGAFLTHFLLLVYEVSCRENLLCLSGHESQVLARLTGLVSRSQRRNLAALTCGHNT